MTLDAVGRRNAAYARAFSGFFVISRRRRTPWEVCGSGTAGTRTQDQSLKRALLYQLSYRPKERKARIIAELPGQFTTITLYAYTVGSATPAAANPAARKRQESHFPQARPVASAW